MEYITFNNTLFYIKQQPILRDRFDFDVGYLIKSPCKTCKRHEDFPNCSESCDIIDEIQTRLAAGISCSRG